MTDIFQKRILVPSTLATWCKRSTHWKRPWCWEKTEGGRRRGRQRMRWLDGITESMYVELEQAPGVGNGQRGLECCSPWVRQRARHDWATELNWSMLHTWFLSHWPTLKIVFSNHYSFCNQNTFFHVLIHPQSIRLLLLEATTKVS